MHWDVLFSACLCVCTFAHCCLGNSAENTVILETPWKMFTFPFLWDLLYHPVWKGAVDLLFFFFFLFFFFPFLAQFLYFLFQIFGKYTLIKLTYINISKYWNENVKWKNGGRTGETNIAIKWREKVEYIQRQWENMERNYSEKVEWESREWK